MNSQGYVKEIEFQTKMINNLKKWIKITMMLSTLGILITYIFIQSTPLKILGICVTILSVLLSIIIGLAIYNGQNNVNKVIDELESLKGIS